ncbi:MAG: dTDP-4-dehydrorhamnose 3,5-epimerase family protein [Geminicoccaceae bacterium]|nr:dTDP-4-dehydrorhamnose 3,5-epimerase family protein [Geminicoccaceae bacterium]
MRRLANPMPGVHLLEAEPRRDERGAFARTFCVDEMAGFGIVARVRQGNLSRTSRPGTVRGLHFQRPPFAETKIVQCLAGSVHDAVVDLRMGSPTFGSSFTATLSPGNGRIMVVPEGCAHGFQALAQDSLVHYLVTAPYAPEAEGGLRYDDPFAAVVWPLPPRHVSARDLAHAPFDPALDALPGFSAFPIADRIPECAFS